MAREDDDDLWSEVNEQSRTFLLSILADPRSDDFDLYVTMRLAMTSVKQVLDLEARQVSKRLDEENPGNLS